MNTYYLAYSDFTYYGSEFKSFKEPVLVSEHLTKVPAFAVEHLDYRVRAVRRGEEYISAAAVAVALDGGPTAAECEVGM